MKKYFKQILFLFIIVFSISFSGEKKRDKIIKAYDKGKPAQLNIEVTKVKSDNFVEMTIDRYNKKIYKDITKFSSENRDLDSKLFVTDYLKKVDKSDLNRTLPYTVISHDEKKYLEIDYSSISEPEKIYLWVVRKGKVKKLYTGVIKDEYFNPYDLSTFVHMELENSDKKKIVEIGGDHFIFKIGEIRLRDDVNDTLKISIPSKKNYFLRQQSVDYPVSLYFDENESEVYLNKSQNVVTLYGKYIQPKDQPILEKGDLFEENSSSLNLEIEKVQRTRAATFSSNESEPLQVNDYSISTMSFFDPWIDITYDMSKSPNDNTVSATLGKPVDGFLTSAVIDGSKNMDGNAGTSTYRIRSLVYIEKINVTVYLNNGNSSITKTISANNKNTIKASDGTHLIDITNTIKTNFFDIKPSTIEIHRASNTVEKVEINYETDFFSFGGKNEVVIFHFLDAPLKFSVNVTKDLNFGEIYNSLNITFTANGELEITLPKDDLKDFYTLEFMKGYDPTTELAIALDGEEDPSTNQQIPVIGLSCNYESERSNENNKIMTYKMKGSIVNMNGKQKGAYSAVARLRITRDTTKGGQF